MLIIDGITEDNLTGKVALVTADSTNNVAFRMNGETSDSTGFMNWIWVWRGRHFSYKAMAEDCSLLNNFSVVIFSGNPGGFNQLISICSKLNKDIVTMFLPEGDACLYDMQGIRSFSATTYKALNICDVFLSMEEDKISYYESILDIPAVFVHVPIDYRMSTGQFLVPRDKKSEHILVYGDNNPNCPVTVFACAKKLQKSLELVEIPKEFINDIENIFKVKVFGHQDKLGQYPFLRLLGGCYIHIYPTRWIGSSRESISCAVVGTPCIGSDRSHTQRRLYPDLACDPYDVIGMVNRAKALYSGPEYYDYVCHRAFKEVQFYNMENTITRFMEAYVIGLKKKGLK